MDNNAKTLKAYQDHVPQYLAGSPQKAVGGIKAWLDKIATNLTPQTRIIEIGSAMGRDAHYLQTLGFTVECTDAVPAFVDLLKQKGFAARQLNILTDELDGPYGLVLAYAVLLHFTPEQTDKVIKKIYQALDDTGIFAFTLKEGSGEEWTEQKLGAPRYFCYWNKADIEALLRKNGFSHIDINRDKAPPNVWLQVLAKK